jgi:hypothetical protein
MSVLFAQHIDILAVCAMLSPPSGDTRKVAH